MIRPPPNSPPFPTTPLSRPRGAGRPTGGANNRGPAPGASPVPAVPTSVVVQTPSRGPYQMMAGSWGTTARAMLDRNAYAKSSAVGVAGRCMARCFAHRSQADIKSPQYARRVAGEADLGYDAPSPGDEALHEESHRRQHDSEGVGMVPLRRQAGEVIARVDGLPVALKRSSGRGNLIFLGSPLGPALWAGDAEARRWLFDCLGTAGGERV